MMWLLGAMTLAPLSGTLAGALGARVRVAGAVTAASSAGTLALALAVVVRSLSGDPYAALGDYVYVDALSAFFCLTIAIVIALAGVGSMAYVHTEVERGRLSHVQARVYFVAFGLFASLMLASLESANLGIVWVLIEGSTLASAVLVGLEAKGPALEAAWKYVIISSLGVAVALLGTLYLSFAASGLHVGAAGGILWPVLVAHARALQPEALRLAFLLAVVGYGTKVGLSPMHTWLPDAHAEAPSPASAMLSGAILNVGMYAIIRFRAVAVAGLGPGFADHTLLAFGFLSVVIGALFMVHQGNFKRLFAYSSIEQMGIISVGLGFGGLLGLYGALLQVLTHAIGKSVLFLSSGDVMAGWRTRESSGVSGVLGALPLTGAVLLLGSFAILGAPPFGLFLSEFSIVRAGFQSSNPLLPALLLGLFVVAFVAFARTTTAMVLGSGPDHVAPCPSSEMEVLASMPLLAGLGALLVLGLWIPSGLDHLLLRSVGVMR